ncbi:MAG: HpcH/HpaI aldolase/citrate lyase family protein [Halobacteriales archaeon]
MTQESYNVFSTSERPVGTWISIGHPVVAEVTAELGLDFLLIDLEHTPIDLQTVENMIRAVEATGSETQVVVRVADNDPVRLKQILDTGISTVMVPMIETSGEARDLVDAVKYPPEGIRGVASGRATGYGRDFEEYVETVNARISTIVQVETLTGLENVEEIADVAGVDALFVGPSDLSASLGLFGDRSADEFDEAVERIVAAGRSADVPVGTLSVDPDGIERCVRRGFDFLIVGKDTASLATATMDAKDRFERAIDQETPAETE